MIVISEPARSGWQRRLPALLSFVAGALPALLVPLTASAFWPIAVAPEVWHHHAVHFASDPISPLPIRGGEWVVQPWLPALAFWGAWSAAGVAGVAAIAALVGGLTTWMLHRTAAGFTQRVPALVSTLLVLPLLQPELAATQEWAVLLAAVLWLQLRTPAWWWSGPVLVAVWANVHGSVPIGVALCWAAGIGALPHPDRTACSPWRERPERVVPILVASWPRRIVWMLACAGAMFLTPLGVGIVDYIRSVRSIKGLEALTPVWRPLDLHSWRLWWIVVLVAIVAFGVIYPRIRERGRAWVTAGNGRGALPLLTLLPFLALALQAVRNVVWLPVVLAPFVAMALERLWRRRAWAGELNSRLVAGTLALVAVAFTAVLFPGTPMERKFALAALPERALWKPIHQHDTVFASAEWADYVRVRTGARVLVDARLERYRARELGAYLDRTQGRAGPDVERDATLYLVRFRTAQALVDTLTGGQRGGGPACVVAGSLDKVTPSAAAHGVLLARRGSSYCT